MLLSSIHFYFYINRIATILTPADRDTISRWPCYEVAVVNVLYINIYTLTATQTIHTRHQQQK